MGNLANTLGCQGMLDEATTTKREVLKKTQRILGGEHPCTIMSQNNLFSPRRNRLVLEMF